MKFKKIYALLLSTAIATTSCVYASSDSNKNSYQTSDSTNSIFWGIFSSSQVPSGNILNGPQTRSFPDQNDDYSSDGDGDGNSDSDDDDGNGYDGDDDDSDDDDDDGDSDDDDGDSDDDSDDNNGDDRSSTSLSSSSMPTTTIVPNTTPMATHQNVSTTLFYISQQQPMTQYAGSNNLGFPSSLSMIVPNITPMATHQQAMAQQFQPQFAGSNNFGFPSNSSMFAAPNSFTLPNVMTILNQPYVVTDNSDTLSRMRQNKPLVEALVNNIKINPHSIFYMYVNRMTVFNQCNEGISTNSVTTVRATLQDVINDYLILRAQICSSRLTQAQVAANRDMISRLWCIAKFMYAFFAGDGLIFPSTPTRDEIQLYQVVFEGLFN